MEESWDSGFGFDFGLFFATQSSHVSALNNVKISGYIIF